MRTITIAKLADTVLESRRAMSLLLRFVVVTATLFLITGCRGVQSESNNGTAGGIRNKTAERSPIEPARLRADAERQAEWTPVRQAKCPRQLPDRHEELARYPAISVLQGLGYITITDGTAHGMYVKNMELTIEGRRELGRDVEEDADKYIITIARREYLPGTEQFEILPGPDRLVSHFKWRWTPINGLGERLTLGSQYSPRGEYGGFCTYNHVSGDWVFDKMYLNKDNRDYLWGF